MNASLYLSNIMDGYRLFENLTSLPIPEKRLDRFTLSEIRMLNNAITLHDLRVSPANRLEKPSGDRAGQYSIRINDQWDRWRICFEGIDDDAYYLEIVDYHLEQV